MTEGSADSMITTSRPSCFCVETTCSFVVLSVPASCAFARSD
jgi:hypothetical protein